MKGTHMSGRDLIYRDLSCWPTPLHYHPAHACGPFYLTLLHSLPPCSPSVSRSAPPPSPSHPQSICLSDCLSFTFPMHIICMCDPTKWICPRIKDLFFTSKAKGTRSWLYETGFAVQVLLPPPPLPPPPSPSPPFSCLSQVQARHHHAFLSPPGSLVFKEALKVESGAHFHVVCFAFFFCFFFIKTTTPTWSRAHTYWPLYLVHLFNCTLVQISHQPITW